VTLDGGGNGGASYGPTDRSPGDTCESERGPMFLCGGEGIGMGTGVGCDCDRDCGSEAFFRL
jgi:hypothetical protein